MTRNETHKVMGITAGVLVLSLMGGSAWAQEYPSQYNRTVDGISDAMQQHLDGKEIAKDNYRKLSDQAKKAWNEFNDSLKKVDQTQKKVTKIEHEINNDIQMQITFIENCQDHFDRSFSETDRLAKYCPEEKGATVEKHQERLAKLRNRLTEKQADLARTRGELDASVKMRDTKADIYDAAENRRQEIARQLNSYDQIEKITKSKLTPAVVVNQAQSNGLNDLAQDLEAKRNETDSAIGATQSSAENLNNRIENLKNKTHIIDIALTQDEERAERVLQAGPAMIPNLVNAKIKRVMEHFCEMQLQCSANNASAISEIIKDVLNTPASSDPRVSSSVKAKSSSTVTKGSTTGVGASVKEGR